MSVPTAQAVYEVEELSERLAEDGVDTNDGEWYAIHTDPWPCPACGEVFDYVTDPTHFPEWQANVVGGHMAGETAV